MKKLTAIGGHLAFSVVVATSYLSAITAIAYARRPVPPPWQVAVLIPAAIAYLVVGTYGFSLCRRSAKRGRAAIYFIVQLLLAAVLLRIPGLPGGAGELSLIILPLAGQSALLLRPHWMVAVCAAIYVLLFMPLILVNRWTDALAVAVIYGTGLIFVVVFTWVAASEREARARLAEAYHLLRESAAQAEELAVANERNRLAREIHDSLGHYLTVVNVQIGAAQAIFSQDGERALDHLSKARTLTQEGLTEVRRSVAALRSSPTEGRPLPDALRQLVQHWNTTGVRASFDIVGTQRQLTPQADLTLYRAAQEALTNVSKHARATRVDLTLDYGRPESVLLKVQDDGVGSGGTASGFGLLGVRERAQLLGGEVRTATGDGRGFRLEVELPE